MLRANQLNSNPKIVSSILHRFNQPIESENKKKNIFKQPKWLS